MIALVVIGVLVGIGLFAATAAQRADGGHAGAQDRAETGVPRRDRRLLVAGLALPLVVGVVVLVVGIERPPALEDLDPASADAPSAAVAWARWSGGDGSCIEVARPDGSTQRLTCLQDDGELIAWDADGLVWRSWSGPDPALVTLDPASGAVVGREPDTRRDEPRELSSGIRTSRDDRELVVVLEREGTELWRVATGDAYDVHLGARSPDGRWVAMVDRAGRVLVVPADGGAAPRVWARDVPAWTTPIWEGTVWTPASEEG